MHGLKIIDATSGVCSAPALLVALTAGRYHSIGAGCERMDTRMSSIIIVIFLGYKSTGWCVSNAWTSIQTGGKESGADKAEVNTHVVCSSLASYRRAPHVHATCMKCLGYSFVNAASGSLGCFRAAGNADTHPAELLGYINHPYIELPLNSAAARM
jgi:hypothetical protein